MLKISVVTAVFNARKTVGDAIDSILSQSHPDIELIVIDGGSTDGTRELLEQYRYKLSVFISESDNGIYDALNKGVAQASGDIVGFLHADDLFAGEHVLAGIAAAFANPAVDAVYGDLVYVSKSEPDRVIRYWQAGEFSRRKLQYGWMPPHPTFYVRRSVYERMGAFDTSFHIASDYDCMLRFLGRGRLHCMYLPKVLVKMRVGGKSNRSLSNILRKSYEDWNALRSNQVGGVGALIWKNVSKLGQFYKPKKRS